MSEQTTAPDAPAPPPVSVAPPGRPPATRAAAFRWYPQLTRISDDAVVAGVCAGLAAHLGVRVTLVRLAMVLLAAISGAGVLFYAALWALTPSGRARRGPHVPAGGSGAAGWGCSSW